MRFCHQKKDKLKFDGKPTSYKDRPAQMKEAAEAIEEEKEESEKVAEKIVDELENIGIKCPRCGLKNVKQDKELSRKDGKVHLECLDCENKWVEE